ncbi:hypothetical protein CHS0354_010449 [Potamilus streckersoni]|uniref:Uncharacterized protein n=1 Tax=Potamilus streckersoni TaxID=2493646 RepID=A0AAE0SR28_9BIVA|nr:hypothetical protein CHS0354_010449 [Potamilus streckersoni]
MSAFKVPQVKYLPSNKKYHWNIIYDDDSDAQDPSHKFVEFLLLMNESVSQISGTDVLDVPESPMTSAEVTHITTRSIGMFQPATDSGASNSHSLNDQLETDNPQNHSKRQITTGSPSPSPSSSSFVSLSDDPDLTFDQPPSSQEVQNNDADYALTKLNQAVNNINPNTLKLGGKSLSFDSLVNSLSNDHSESTNPNQTVSPSDSGYTSERGMTTAHDISPPSQENLQREVTSYKSDTRVDNSESAQIDPEWKNTRSKDTRDNQTKTLDATSGQQPKMTGMDEIQPTNSININSQERMDLVSGERTGPDGCESVFSDAAASDSADLMSMSRLSKWKRTKIVGGSHIIKSIINGFTRTDSFI